MREQGIPDRRHHRTHPLPSISEEYAPGPDPRFSGHPTKPKEPPTPAPDPRHKKARGVEQDFTPEPMPENKPPIHVLVPPVELFGEVSDGEED